jgi:Tfp pilus assembly protein PilF
LADGGQDSGPTQAPIPEAKAAARHAIELDPDNGEAWSVLGEIATNNDWDWKTAEYDLQRAIALSPSDPTTELRYANFLSTVGRPDEAVSHMRRALELDPLSFLCVRHMGSVLYWSRRYDESLEYLRKAEEMEPGLVGFTESWVIDDDEMKGLHDEAVMATLKCGLSQWRTKSVFGNVN